MVNDAGVVIKGTQARTTARHRRIPGEYISNLVMYQSEVQTIIEAIEDALGKGVMKVVRYTVDDLCFFALMIPTQKPGFVLAFEVYADLFKDRKRALKFLWRQYEKCYKKSRFG